MHAPAELSDGSHPRWDRRVCWLLAGLLLFRLAYLVLVPLDLVHDEAYYWEWSRQLDWGYYSKPPGVAWLIALATRLGASSPFWVRLPAAVLSTAALSFIYLLGKQIYGPRAGFWAALLAAATPGNAALGVVMTIDAPLMFFWSAALYGCWRMLESADRRWQWTVLTACAVGLGMLCKQTMLAFPALALLLVVCHPGYRPALRRPSFWLCGVAAMAFLFPVAWWNSRHGWITIAHTREHFAGATPSITRRAADCLEFLASQLAVVSPLTWLLAMLILVAVVTQRKRLDRAEWYLAVFSGLPLAGVMLLSLRQRLEANWPSPFYVSAMILVAGAAACPRRLRLPQFALYRAVTVGLAFAGVTYAIPFLTSGLGWQGTRLDPVVRMWGWRELGREVGQHLQTLPRPERTLVLVRSERAAASELAFYLPGQPRVYLWKPTPQIRSQYDVWGLPGDRWGWDALIVSRKRLLDERLATSFARCHKVGQVVVPIGNGRRHCYHLWRGEHLLGWSAQPALRLGNRPESARKDR
jgi:4-amino-4-deoxy-L-arabinose transferase-like glycosyltransferase